MVKRFWPEDFSDLKNPNLRPSVSSHAYPSRMRSPELWLLPLSSSRAQEEAAREVHSTAIQEAD